MSNTLAIATVSAVLRTRIQTLLDTAIFGTFTAFTFPPETDPSPGVYLHLYRVLPNAGWSRTDLPTRSADGRVTSRPRLALNLHYAITFIGAADNTSLDAERLAGLVLTELHARPYLHPDEIEAYLATLGVGDVLADADLGDQLERVRLSFLSMDLEEQSRLWSMVNQSYHRLTVALEAALVLLDDRVAPVTAPPATGSQVTVMPSMGPRLDAASSSARNQPVVQVYAAGDPDEEALVLTGTNLAAEHAVAVVGEVEVSAFADASASQLVVAVNDAAGLPAGVHRVVVRHDVDVDPDPGTVDLRSGAQSNGLAVALVPRISATGPAVFIDPEHEVTLAVVPQPTVGQQLELMLDHTGGAGQIRSSDWQLSGPDVVFTVTGASAGAWLARLTVDGATSLLEGGDGAPFSGPAVTVP